MPALGEFCSGGQFGAYIFPELDRLQLFLRQYKSLERINSDSAGRPACILRRAGTVAGAAGRRPPTRQADTTWLGEFGQPTSPKVQGAMLCNG